MQKIHFSIEINAPKEKVWNAMLEDKTYRKWTESFAPGSHYVGDWSQGTKILFLAPDEKGNLRGMVSKIEENRPFDYISIEHLGVVQDGIEDTTSDEVKMWSGSHENYSFAEKNGVTELTVDMDINDDYKAMFEEMWPKALKKLKNIAEK